MDLTSDASVGVFGMLVAETVEALVDSHDGSLDKRAAMLLVEPPTFSSEDARMRFTFKVRGNRQVPVESAINIEPTRQLANDPESGDDDDLVQSLNARPHCECEQFAEQQRCVHTLAISWWLQEQLGRQTVDRVFEFLTDLQMDTVAAGRNLVDEVLKLAKSAKKVKSQVETARLQWRIRLSNSRYYPPISITAYEQRQRKTGKGWTKGKLIRPYDLLRRDFSDYPIDGQIAALIANPSYSFEEEHFPEFQAIKLLDGHPNVVWEDAESCPCDVHLSELVLSLQSEGADSEVIDAEDATEVDFQSLSNAPRGRFFARLEVSGINISPHDCDCLFGYSSPVEPMVVLADPKHHRLVVCVLRNEASMQLVRMLLNADLRRVQLDAEAAAKFSIGSSNVDSLIRVKLPPQLAGPIEPVAAELIIELRPRGGSGLSIALRMFDDRFRELLIPGQPPETVACLTEQGPVRLKRDLLAERAAAEQVIERFSLNGLHPDGPDRWVAQTDEEALDLLAKLYSGGDQTPRMTWPEGESIRVRGEITPSALRVQIDDRRDWFGLSGTISLDGREIPLADLLTAVRDQRSLVQVGDRQFAKISDAFRRRLQQLSDVVVADHGTLRIADAVIPAVNELIGVDVPLEATARWHQILQRLETLADWYPQQPEQLQAHLRDYQLEGFQWLARLSTWGVGGVLADDMGLGKTVQALGALLLRAADGPALVVAPTSVGENWVRETERFAPSLRARLYRDADRTELIDSVGPGDLVIVSYQLLQRDAKRFLSRTWNTLVLDEAQFIKNAQTKTSQAIRRIEADWRIGLSGTPLENHLGELWSLFRTLSPGLLGSWERFRQRFADPIERLKDDQRRESLARLVRPFILRRTKDKVLRELPPRTEITLQAELSPLERRKYEDARLAALADLSGAVVDDGQAGQQRIRTLAWLTRLRQLACHPRLVDTSWKKSSAKLDLLVSLIDELREGEHRALVFSQFVKHLTVVRETLDQQGVTYQYLDGATPAKERQRRVDAFQAGEGELFLISLKAGGTGLNLTGADYVIHLDPWWNPAVEDQATDRAHRIGQQRPVTVYRLVAQGTIEEQILALHADKRELVAGVLDGTDVAASMDTADLIRLIKEGASG